MMPTRRSFGMLLDDWSECALRRIAVIANGATPESNQANYWDGDVIWVTPSDLGQVEGDEISDSARKLTAVGVQSCATTVVPAGSVILSTRAPIGHVAVASRALCFNQGCRGLTMRHGDSPQYYAYILRSTRDYLQALGSGSTFAELSTNDLAALRVPRPPISMQGDIVRFLEEKERDIDHYLAAKRRMIEVLEERKLCLLDAYLHVDHNHITWESGSLPKSWRLMPFTKSVIDQADYRGATPTKTASGVILVTARNVRRGWIDYNISCEYVSREEYPHIMRRGLPRLDDLLFTTEAPLGNVALVDREDIALAQRIIRFRMNPALFRARFALFGMMSTSFQRQLLIRGSGSTAEGIKASKLHELRLPCPPLGEQDNIVDCISRNSKDLNESISLLRKEIRTMEEYRTRLIADAVTGQIDVRRLG